ncbi:hypothetical protein CONPUDRAFT_71247 [Coniophora puteana RWD-64-598 SS2]|uniref:Uncharacterized protein n=1 Tax=Coniophora puteana (strain RWD-64-598) TaxID=741705 RepID=A0A5M3N0B3_CONPW|nr:uncharacterized protein CONPUDRAFT_71247 [Coniophora puteana RWD-64-598 SS2]EIW84484.1 hypothetical protein CONPUDRAFT_71247 [Coniophora puteana RWD-64-598 SS2]
MQHESPNSRGEEDFFSDDEALRTRSVDSARAQREADKLKDRINVYLEQREIVLHIQERSNARRRSDVPPRPVVFVDEQVSLAATLADSDSDSDGEDDHFRLWTVEGCLEAVSYIESLVNRFSRGKTPSALSRSVFARFCKAAGTKDSEKREKRIRGNIQYGINELYSFHEHIHRVQHALYQLTGAQSDEWSKADSVGCMITKYIAMISDVQNHVIGGNVDMFESSGLELFLFMTEP